jgi:hypothetical protein
MISFILSNWDWLFSGGAGIFGGSFIPMLVRKIKAAFAAGEAAL